MPKLYLFAIGGTGSRVLHSAIMLMASGLKMNAREVIPIIIDPDTANSDLDRVIRSISDYQYIQSKAGNLQEGFFSTQLGNIFPEAGRYLMNFTGLAAQQFRNYIGFDVGNDINTTFSKLLFSDSHLDLNMGVGFQGNPNLGSVALNQFEGNADFNAFGLSFTPGDRIFIISSIHGGTGAAGFPLILKKLRDITTNAPNHVLFNIARIGAVTVLPYFRLQAGVINSQDFISKTKAALEYYIGNVNPSLDSMYYIGYSHHINGYENQYGGQLQRNPAHFVELAAALAIFDFMNKPDDELQRGNRFMEFGIDGNPESEITFNELDDSVRGQIRLPLIQFELFSKFIKIHLEESISNQPWGVRGSASVKFGKEYLKEDFKTTLDAFISRFNEWLSELSENSPSFNPFRLDVSKNKLTSELVRNQHVQNKHWFMDNLVLFDHILNGCERKKHIADLRDRNKKFISLFNEATKSFLTDYYNL